MHMKVTQTLQATDSDGNVVEFTKPVSIKWYEGDSPAKAVAAIANIIADAEDRKFTKTIAIHIDL